MLNIIGGLIGLALGLILARRRGGNRWTWRNTGPFSRSSGSFWARLRC
jgi:hypothetical protein